MGRHVLRIPFGWSRHTNAQFCRAYNRSFALVVAKWAEIAKLAEQLIATFAPQIGGTNNFPTTDMVSVSGKQTAGVTG